MGVDRNQPMEKLSECSASTAKHIKLWNDTISFFFDTRFYPFFCQGIIQPIFLDLGLFCKFNNIMYSLSPIFFDDVVGNGIGINVKLGFLGGVVLCCLPGECDRYTKNACRAAGASPKSQYIC